MVVARLATHTSAVIPRGFERKISEFVMSERDLTDRLYPPETGFREPEREKVKRQDHLLQEIRRSSASRRLREGKIKRQDPLPQGTRGG